MIAKEDMPKLLGRPLTSIEDANYDLYIDIATEKLNGLLCFKLCDDTATKKFEARRGYRTLYINPCAEVSAVTIDDKAETGYTLRQNEFYDGDWYNIIEFNYPLTDTVVSVTADWGFHELPTDLAQLLGKVFDTHSKSLTTDLSVKSKRIEDFSVTYKDDDAYDLLVMANQSTIYKYAQCERGILHG